MNNKLLWTAACSILLLSSFSVKADAETEQLREQVRLMQAQMAVMQKKLDELERREDKQSENKQTASVIAKPTEAVQKPPEQASVEIGSKGLTITSPKKDFALELHGTMQIDYRHFVDNNTSAGASELLARRLRPNITLTAYENFSFTLAPDFAGDTTRIFDAYAEYAYSEGLNVRVGKFKPPISLERLQSAADMFFIERGYPANLAPNRDIGATIYGTLLAEKLEYELGVLNGNADLGNSDGDEDDHKDLVARLFAHPFANSGDDALKGLGIGIAGSYGEREGSTSRTILENYRSPGQQAIFRYTSSASAPAANTYADGTHWRLYPQAYYYYDNFGILAEYAIFSQEVTRLDNHATLNHIAWQVAGSYVLTGEDVGFQGGVTPANNFDIHEGGWGAFELVARVGQIDIDDDAFPGFASAFVSASKASSFGTGINWYLNESVKLWLNYDYTNFDGGAPSGDRPDEQVVMARTQYRF